MSRLVVNFVAFQAAWFACVLGAANGLPLLGPAVVLAVVTLHLVAAERPRQELALIALAGVMGALFDSILVRTGWLAYPNGVLWAGTAPYWIVAMWLSFATTLNVSLRWLRGRPWLAAAFGAIGGPSAYYAGSKFGGLTFVDMPAALLALAVGWAVVTPLLFWISTRLDGIENPRQWGGQHV